MAILAGVFGVTLMIFESGLHVDFQMLRKVGLKATAVVHTYLPSRVPINTCILNGVVRLSSCIALCTAVAPSHAVPLLPAGTYTWERLPDT